MAARTGALALFTTLCGAAAIAAHLSAQTTSAQQPQSNPPVFRSGSSLATLDLHVTDRQGRPVDDLRADEVEIVDDGVRRPVVLLRHVNESGRSYQESMLRTVASEVSTNQGAPRGQLYVLLIDQQHITAGREQPVRIAAEKFLRTRATSQDRVAIYGVPGPGPNQRFTSNITSAIAQLQSIRGGLERMVTGVAGDMTMFEAYEIARGNEEVLSRFLVPSSNDGSTANARTSALIDMLGANGKRAVDQATVKRLVQENAALIVSRADGETRRFLVMAAELLHGLRGIDGRKTVLLFSEGFNQDNVTREMRDLEAAAAETFSVIYSVDLNARFDAAGGESRGNDTSKENAILLDPLGSLASQSGGQLLIDASARLDQVFASVANPNSNYYLVGFEPPAAADGGSTYRNVQVRVTRPGVTVSTRSGYSATSAASRLDRRTAIDAALASPYSQQSLAIEYTTYVSRGDAAGQERVAVSLEADLPVAANAGTNADVVFVVRDSRTGQVVASGTSDMPLPSRALDGRATGRSAWHVQFSAAPGSYLMRCVVREPGGLVGSADRRFIVRNLTGPDIAPSDVLIAGSALQVRAIVDTSAPLQAAMRVYGRSTTQLADISASLTLESPAGAFVSQVSGLVGTDRLELTSASRDVSFTMPIAAVAPGAYIAHVILRDKTETVADLRREVVVTTGHPIASSAANDSDAPKGAAASDIAAALAARVRDKTDRASVEAVRGIEALRSARYIEAASALGSSFDARQDAGAAFLLGWARRGAGDNAGAASAFRSAAFLDTRMIPAHLALAQTYLAMREPALAAQSLRAGLAIVPDAIELQILLKSIGG